MKNFNALEACLAGVKSLAIAGHVRPDGDCVGSCMAVYNYARENMPQIQVDVYLQEIPESLDFLKGTEDIHHSCEENKTYDAFLALDCGDRERLGAAVRYFDSAKKRICVDHHISNTGLGEQYVIDPAACATCEILYELLNPEKMSLAVAEALYTGLINDCGVFQYSNTTPKTMRIAAKLMEKGVPFTRIIEESFYQKTYLQNQILGRALMESMLVCDGQVIVSVIRKKDMEFYGVDSRDLEGIVSQLRNTKGVEVAIFLYETAIQEYKVSMRSNGAVDVSKIAVYYNGGGHVKAAGCTMQGSIHDVINNLTGHIARQLDGERRS